MTPIRTTSRSLRLAALALAGLGACTSTGGGPPILIGPDAAVAPDLAVPPVPPDLAVPPVPPDLAVAAGPDLAPPTTQLAVAYKADCANITVRGSAPPLDWNRDAPTKLGPGNRCVFETPDLRQPVEWKPLWKGAWSRGANYTARPGEQAVAYPHFTTGKGRVVKLFPAFKSAALGNTRAVWAYLPPSYDENPEARYPAVYMHDGQNLFDPALAFGGNEWKVDETLDAGADVLDRAQSIRELIVIAPENTNARIDEYTPTRDADIGAGGRGDLYIKMLVDELKPEVDRALRTSPGPIHTGVLGSSLGGLISAHAGVRRPDVFGVVGAMSPSTWWDNRVIIATVAGVKGQPQRALRVYVDSGDAGPSMDGVADTRDLAQTYVAAGYVEGGDLHYLVQKGAQHNEIYWAQRLPGALRFLFGGQAP